MKYKLLINLFFAGVFTTSSLAQAPKFEWAKALGGSADDKVMDAVFNNDGSSVLIGHFRKDIDMDGDGGTEPIITQGSKDIFIQKLDNNGSLLWWKHIGGPEADEANKVATDSDDNIYIAGTFSHIVDFDPATKADPITGENTGELNAENGKNLFLLKLNSSGEFQWVKNIGNEYDTEVKGLETDQNDRLYLTGQYTGLIDIAPGSQQQILPQYGAMSAFILQLNKDGEHIWSNVVGGAGSQYIYGLAVNESGEVFTSGFYVGELIIKNNSETIASRNSPSDFDMFIAKQNTDGSFAWLKSYGGPGLHVASEVTILNSDDIVVGGICDQSLNVNPDGDHGQITNNSGRNQSFLLKLSSEGDFKWAKHIASTENLIISLASNSKNDIYVTGYFNGNIDFDPSDATDFHNNYQYSSFLSKYTEDGTYGWTKSMVSDKTNWPTSLTCTADSKLLLTGYFDIEMNMPAGAGIPNFSGAEMYEGYTIKINDTDGKATNIKNTKLVRRFKASPNPSHGPLKLTLDQQYAHVKVSIINRAGRVCMSEHYTNSNTIQMNISELASGLYFVKVADDNGYSEVLKIRKN